MKTIRHGLVWVMAFFCVSVSFGYNVWMGTHQWDGDGAYNLDQWDRAIENIDGINYVLLDSRVDKRADATEWRTMIAQIDQSIPGMAEIARSQYIPGKNISLASRMENEFATVEGKGGVIDIMMLYDEERDGTIYYFTAADFQEVRDWLDNNEEAHVKLSFDYRAGGGSFVTRAREPLIDEILIEANATKWVNGDNSLHTGLIDLWTDSRTSYKPLRFQIPGSADPAYNPYEETRRALKTIKELMGDEFMRSDQISFIICDYSDNLALYPETANNDTLYTNTKSGIALALIEQRPIFEGRVGVVDQAFCLSYDRYEVSTDPTSGLVAHWPLDEGSGTIATNTAGSSYTATLENGTTWGSDAERGTYAVFDGTDDRIATTFTYALNATNDFTWAWWAKQLDTETGSIMVGSRYGNTGSESLEFIKFMRAKASFANTGDAANIENYDYADLPSNEWHHYAMVKDGTSYQWYVDGVAQGASQTINYSETTPIPFRIGGDIDGKPNECFNGYIDDVVLYRQALTSAEINNVISNIYLPVITLTTLGTPVDSTEPTAWSDGAAAHSGADYVIPNTGNVRGETGITTFPGNSLTVEPGGKYQVRSLDSSSQITTVNQLILEGGTGTTYALLAAGTGTDEINVLDGNLINSGSSRLITYGSTINRSLDILSQVSGTGILQANGGATVTIDNAENTFSGTWQVDTGTTLQFNSGDAVGSADIDVLSGGTLTISGNWATDATLTVADAASTVVNFGANTWLVSNLVFSGSAVTDGSYTASELNALGANTVFAGTGTLVVNSGGTLSDTLYSNAADAGVKEDETIENLTSSTALVGTGGSNPWVDRAIVYVFQIPDLGVVDNPFLNSSFSFNYALDELPKNTDLYGLGKRGVATVLGSDYYGQTATADPTDATLIQSSILTDSSATGIITADNSTLTDYLNAQYDGGNGIGQYVFLRLNTATAKTGLNRATLTMSEGGVGDTRPQLSYTAINAPEPAENEVPTISDIADQAVLANESTEVLTFTVGDSGTPPANLTLSKTSSDTTLVPEANIVFGGSGADRTVTVTPATGQSGDATISVIVSDGELSATNSFQLTVYPEGSTYVSVTNNVEGTTAWICPTGVTSIQVECWGGGGAGGAANASADNVGGGGGAGGAYARTTDVPVTPGSSYSLPIPAAATAPAGSVDGARFDGADVTFIGDSSVTVTAAGGQGGECKVASVNVAGAGGTASTAGCVGDVVFAGGNGVQWVDRNGGAGGGGAGNANPGGDGFEGTAGLGGAEGGGDGGGGRAGNASGQNGSNPGGGGGGAKSQSSGPLAGGTGGLGQIIITYLQLPATEPPSMWVDQVGGDFTFSWSNSTFKLQYRTNLIEGSWADYEEGATSPVVVSPTNSSAFFRLIEQ